VDLDVKPALAQAARNRTILARLAATASHDLGNILTILQAGVAMSGAASSPLAREGVVRLSIFSDIIAGLDRGGTLTLAGSALKPAVFDAINAIKGVFDIDLRVADSPSQVTPECNIPRAQLTAATYAALDGAARAARAQFPVQLGWLEDQCFAGVRIEVPAMIRQRSFERVEIAGGHCRFGIEQALTLTHRFGGYALCSFGEQASHIELRWRKSGTTGAEPSGPVVWLGAAQQDVLALVPAVSAWPRHSQYRGLLDGDRGVPRAVVGLVTPEWDDRSLLETLRWLRAAGSTVLPLVRDMDAAAFITEEFGADCPTIRWPVELERFSDWAKRQNK